MQSLSVVDEVLLNILLVKEPKRSYLFSSLTKYVIVILLKMYNQDQKARVDKTLNYLKWH